MTDPMALAIATGIVSKSAEIATESARETVAAIIGKVRGRFRGRPEEATLTAAQENPGSPVHVEALADALHVSMAEDAEFGAELRGLWSQVRMDVTAQDDGVVNTFHGQAGKVIMMRDIHGDLHL